MLKLYKGLLVVVVSVAECMVDVVAAFSDSSSFFVYIASSSSLEELLGLNHYATSLISIILNAKQKHLGCKKGEANQKQQLSDYKSIHSYTCD